jgi:hypothetical protein
MINSERGSISLAGALFIALISTFAVIIMARAKTARAAIAERASAYLCLKQGISHLEKHVQTMARFNQSILALHLASSAQPQLKAIKIATMAAQDMAFLLHGKELVSLKHCGIQSRARWFRARPYASSFGKLTRDPIGMGLLKTKSWSISLPSINTPLWANFSLKSSLDSYLLSKTKEGVLGLKVLSGLDY